MISLKNKVSLITGN